MLNKCRYEGGSTKNNMQLESFLNKLKESPSTIDFEDTIAVIDATYKYIPTAFTNRKLSNNAGENEGSCKIFAFAKLHGLSKAETLACFGKYYREDVLSDPLGNNHQNIRNFMLSGWSEINFAGNALISR